MHELDGRDSVCRGQTSIHFSESTSLFLLKSMWKKLLDENQSSSQVLNERHEHSALINFL